MPAEYKTFSSIPDGSSAGHRLTSRPPTSPQVPISAWQHRREDNSIDQPSSSGGSMGVNADAIQPLHVETTFAQSTVTGPSPSPISSFPKRFSLIRVALIQTSESFIRVFAFTRASSQPTVISISPMERPKPKRDAVEFRVRNISAPKEVWTPASGEGKMRGLYSV